MKQVTEYVEY